MRINRSTGYAFLAVCYIAKNQDKKITLSNSIADEYNIPLEYLLKIMQQLVRAGILRSKRGPTGGFSLGMPANKISMLAIIEAVDGPMMSYLYLNELAPKDKFCNKVEKIYEKGVAQAKAVYEKTMFSDLL
jgi:Rrf2 family protein